MLDVHNLSVSFQRYGQWFSRQTLHPIKSLDLTVNAGEVMAVVGESGAGKSLLAHAVLGLLPSNAAVGGDIRFDGEALTPERSRELRGKRISLVPQSVSFLNPLRSVGGQVRRAALLSGCDRKAVPGRTRRLFQQYGLGPRVRRKLPFQISGGMARRVLTAAAVAGDADLIIADEPTTGLDREKSAQSMGYLKQLSRRGKAVLLITHDIASALSIADHVALFKEGCTLGVEKAANFRDPDRLKHPYSKELFFALPQNGFHTRETPDQRVSHA